MNFDPLKLAKVGNEEDEQSCGAGNLCSCANILIKWCLKNIEDKYLFPIRRCKGNEYSYVEHKALPPQPHISLLKHLIEHSVNHTSIIFFLINLCSLILMKKKITSTFEN